MLQRVRRRWEQMRSHVLFVPGLLALVGIVLAVVMIEIDRRIDPDDIRAIPWIFRGGASGARDVVTTIASAMIQISAITFSVTIVALALRSQQFGPRLLRNFTADQVNQAVLGGFIGTFAYSLLVLRAVRDLDNGEIEMETFVPLISVTVAIALALFSLAMFVVFIDRVVSAIQANSIIAAVTKETRRAIDRLFPEPLGEGPEAAADESYGPLSSPCDVDAPRTGYIQRIDSRMLMSAAMESDLVLRMEAPIGGFVVEGTPMITASPRESLDQEAVRRIQEAYVIGQDRSVDEDPEFGLRQIVDLAVKALSPSDNDPTTACTATEFLGALLIDFAARSVPSPLRRDADGTVRVIALGPTFSRMANLAFDQIRAHAEHDVAVTLQLIETIARVADNLQSESRLAVLEEHVWKISRGANKGIRDPLDRQEVNRRLELAMERLGRRDADTLHYLIPLDRA